MHGGLNDQSLNPNKLRPRIYDNSPTDDQPKRLAIFHRHNHWPTGHVIDNCFEKKKTFHKQTGRRITSRASFNVYNLLSICTHRKPRSDQNQD